jgi:hypothetical protein
MVQTNYIAAPCCYGTMPYNPFSYQSPRFCRQPMTVFISINKNRWRDLQLLYQWFRAIRARMSVYPEGVWLADEESTVWDVPLPIGVHYRQGHPWDLNQGVCRWALPSEVWQGRSYPPGRIMVCPSGLLLKARRGRLNWWATYSWEGLQRVWEEKQCMNNAITK